MPITPRERNRLMRNAKQAGKQQPISRDVTTYAKQMILDAMDRGLETIAGSFYDEEREAIIKQRNRVAKFLGVE